MTSYGQRFHARIQAMGMEEVITAPRSPWQNPYVERPIGSIRRECFFHVVIFNARHLRRVLSSYLDYYHRFRTHLALEKDCPEGRPIQPAANGNISPFLRSAAEMRLRSRQDWRARTEEAIASMLARISGSRP